MTQYSEPERKALMLRLQFPSVGNRKKGLDWKGNPRKLGGVGETIEEETDRRRLSGHVDSSKELLERVRREKGCK